MLIGLLVKMLFILVLGRVLIIAGVQTLTIDSQLGTSIEDCFERISIGEQLPADAIYRNVSELTNKECEQICKQDKQCQAYDYGVGAKGNATCNLSNLDEKTIKESNPLTRHPDYDVYIRRFQCEQSPPTPIQVQNDDPDSGPQHRPVFRPEVDEKIPFAEDYLVSGDLYGKPPLSPYRPDDVNSSGPEYDVPPSYGDHKPQEIPYRPDEPSYIRPERPQDPYRPERPQDPYRPEMPQDPYRPDRPPYRPEKPQDPYRPDRPLYRPEKPQDPYRPDRPDVSHKPDRPDTNDVLQFQGYDKPKPPLDDYHKPIDPYRPEKPDYHYIIRPNRKPRPQEDPLKPSDPYGHPTGPIGPPDRPYRPSRPYDKPTYSYHGQYASNYGQNTQNDNSLYVEIADPPRPYIPIKDRPNHPNYQGYLGYGTYSSQNSYSQSQNNQYSGSITEIGGHYGQNDRPPKPVYGPPQEDYHTPGYGSQKPHDDKPSHGNQGGYGSNQGDYGGNQDSYNTNKGNKGSYNANKGSYGGSQSDYGNQGSYGNRPSGPSNYGETGYGSQKPNDYNKPLHGATGSYQSSYKGSYGSSYNEQSSHQASYGSQSSYGEAHLPSQDIYRPGYQKPQKPSSTYDKPYDSQGYGSSQGGYGSNQGGYGSNNQGGYGSNQGGYGSNQGGYGSNQGSSTQSSYGSSQGSYGSHDFSQGGYGSHGSNGQGLYGSTENSFAQGYGSSQTGYGSSQASYGASYGGYGSAQVSQGSYGSTGSYGSQYASRPSHDQKPGYGNRPDHSNRPDYDDHRPDYGYKRPGYVEQRPNHDSQRPGYGDRPDHDSHTIGYGQKPSYDIPKPGYNDPKPGHDDPKPGYNDPGYTDPKPGYDSPTSGYNDPKPGYNDPKPGYNDPKPGYNDPKPGYGSPTSGYNDPKPGYNDPKPGYNDPKPGYNDPKPGYGSPTSGYNDPKPDYDNQTYTDYRPDVRPVYEYEMDKPTNVPAYIAKPGGEVVTSRPVVIGDYGEKPVYKDPGDSYKACFKRVLAGQRALRSFVRKVVPCERLEDCRQECATERRFHCESFNYRLDPAFRGKGLCELMTKPIEAFNIRRDFVQDKDYDFYEIDRNSLEPNCPETLRGPGLLHSGFLSSKNKVEGWDRSWDNRGGHRGYDERRYKGGNRRYEDRNFVPYQIGVSKTDDQDNWGQYGGIYGGSQYYKNRNDYHKSISHWGLVSERPAYGVKPFYNYRNEQGIDFNALRKDIHSSSFDSHSLGKDDHRSSFEYHSLGEDDHRSNFNYHSLGKDDHRSHFNYHSLGKDDHRNSFDYHSLGKDRHFDFRSGKDDHRSNFDYHSLGNDDHRSTFDYHSLGKDDHTRYHSLGREDHIDYHSLGKEDHSSSEDYYGVGNIQHRYGYGAWKKGRWTINEGSNHLDHGDEKTFYEPADRSDEANGKDCFARRRPGMSLSSGAIRRSLVTQNVVACEAACFGEKEFKCVSYSYRYSNSRGSDNCFLSERPFRGLELSADSGSDVYAMPQDQGCATVSHTPWIESECFYHVRSDTVVSGPAVKATLTVAGLGACEAECIRAQGFFCRGFSFRFDSPIIGEELHNCILTSTPPTSLSGGGARRAGGHELYARGNYGRGCEPAVLDSPDDGECYLQYDKAAKLTASAIRGHARVKDEQSCSTACTDAPFRCLSFSYNNDAPPDTDNCLLSEIRLFDLQKDVDYVHSEDDWLFAFDVFNSKCWRRVHNDEPPSHEIPHPIHTSSSEEDTYPGSAPSGPGYLSEPPSGPPEPPYIPGSGPPSGPGYSHESHYPPSSGPIGPYKPDEPGFGPPEPYKPGFRPSKPGFRPPESDLKPGYSPPDSGFRPGYAPPEPYKPGYRPESIEPYPPGFRPPDRDGPPFRPQEQDRPPFRPPYKPEVPYKPEYRPDFKPGFRPSDSHPKPVDTGFKPGYRPGGPGLRPGSTERPGYLPNGRPESPKKPVYQGDRETGGPIEVSWRHYTVSGFPCRAGTTCAQNQIAGHWACEPDGGEIGSWDYCCAPSHRCGYSEGFHKPWCYVGPKEDQWRPCSDKYYPYHQHNTPHPLQGHREDQRPASSTRPHRDPPIRPPDYIPHWDKPPGPYLSPADKMYWDDLYENGPRAYYDKYGNPLPGYSRVPMESRPHIKYRHNYNQPGSGNWVPVSYDDPAGVPGGLGAPRYWPVAYLHKSPPPNMTYFRYNEMRPKPTTTTEKIITTTQSPSSVSRELPEPRFVDQPNDLDSKSTRDDKKINISKTNEVSNIDIDDENVTIINKSTTEVIPSEKEVSKSEVESTKTENYKEIDKIEGIDDKLDDFSKSIEVLDLEDAKCDKLSDVETLEAEERQIEAIGRLLASRRGTKLVLEKRSQKDLETKNIAIDKDLVDFNFGNRFPASERRGVIKRISKDEIERARSIDRSLEVSETTFVRPPRVLSTTENIRKAIVNGKVFYDATIREQRDLLSNASNNNLNRKPKNLRQQEDFKPPVNINSKNIREQRDLYLNSTRRAKSLDRPDDFSILIRNNNKSRGERSLHQNSTRKAKNLREDNLFLTNNYRENNQNVTIKPKISRRNDNNLPIFINSNNFRDQKDLNQNSSRRFKSLKRLEESSTPSLINNNNFGKRKVLTPRNVNPVRRVRRVYRKRYNPEEVRKRLLERERSMKNTTEASKGG